MSDATAAAGPASADPVMYDSGGSRPVLVLLHGLGGTWHIWKPLLGLLEARHRVIALTLPGHRGGPRYEGPGKASVDGLAEQVIASLNARGIWQAHVAGNSLGGWLAIELARRGFARSVVALSPAGGWNTAADFREIARSFRLIYLLLPLILVLTWLFLGFAACRRALGRKTMEHGERMPAQDFRDSLRAMAGATVLPQLLDTMGRDGPVAPFRPDVPVTIAWSGCDRVIPFARYGVPYLQRVEGAHGVILEGVGHVPMYDDPPRVAAQILALSSAGEEQPAGAAGARA
jgi:pimeloyl-ACP methyl ester carboxylesterase